MLQKGLTAVWGEGVPKTLGNLGRQTLPSEGISEQAIMEVINKRKVLDTQYGARCFGIPRSDGPKGEIPWSWTAQALSEALPRHWETGKVTGAVYHGGKEHYEFIGQVFAKWGFCNPLHPAIHPGLRQGS